MDRRTGNEGPLGERLAEILAECGAHAGGIYARAGDRLVLAALAGLPRRFIRPWERIESSISMPISDAVRDHRLIWLGGEDHIAHTYPQFSLAFPYPYALGIVPVPHPPGADATGGALGALFGLWTSPRELTAEEERRLRRAAERVSALLIADDPPAVPSIAAGRPAGEPAPTLSRLPEGLVGLDVEGRPTWASERAAGLLGIPLAELLSGPCPLPAWLDNPLSEDRYRAAMISRMPTAFTAMRPPDNWLRLELFPGDGGMTVRVASVGPGADAPAGPADAPAPAGTLYHVMNLASALTEAVGVRDVVDLVAEQVLPTFDAHGLLMMMVEGDHLRIVGSQGYDEEFVAALDDMPLDAQAPGARTLMEGSPLFLESPADMRRMSTGEPVTGGMAAWAFLPLITSGRPIGTCILAYREPHRFTVEERSVLTALSGLTAQALERARLYDAEHQLATTLQEALLPHTMPGLPGLTATARYLPATSGLEIGGDFYDLIRLDGSHAAAVVGDVQGHNATAAALMGQVRTAIRAFATSEADPSLVLARANRLLTELDVDLFTSCAYAQLDLGTRRMLIARAGHPQPMLRHPDGRVDVLDVPGGLPLGVDPDEEYDRLIVDLPRGGVLAMYTDGLVEVPGMDPDHAVEQLAARLAGTSGKSLEDAADSLVAHAAASRHTDDIAVLLLCFATGGGC